MSFTTSTEIAEQRHDSFNKLSGEGFSSHLAGEITWISAQYLKERSPTIDI